MVFHFGTCFEQYSKMSVMTRMLGRGGYTYVPRAMYSLSRSFWIVPVMAEAGTPCSSATSSYMSRSTAAVELMVMDVVTLSSGRSLSNRRMSASESIATPTLPTSPSERGWSESYPICVGRSNAQERPVWPALRRNLKRSLVASAVPKPAYWRIVQSLPRYIVG